MRAWPSSSRRSSSDRHEPRLQRDERLDDLADHRVGLADHAGLGDGGVLHQRAFDLERADQMPGRLDHVVGAPDEPEVPVGIALARDRRSGTSRRRSTCGSARPRADSRGTSTASRACSASSPSTIGLVDHRHRAVGSRCDDRRLDARQRQPHRAGLDGQRGDSWRS